MNDESYVKENIKEIGYYYLITGYKDLFRNKAVKNINEVYVLRISMHCMNLIKH